ncbi:hypothetical protein ACIHIX_24820 [Streptomyces sp. NPDC051913]
MPETFVDLGSVNAPSGVLVPGMAGWIDHCRHAPTTAGRWGSSAFP